MFKKLTQALVAVAASIVLLAPAPLFAQTTATDDSTYDFNYDYDWESLTDTSYSSSDLTDEQAAALTGLAVFLTGVGLVISIFMALVGYVYGGLTLMTIAHKVKEEPAWLAWIPIGNLYLAAKIAKVSPVSLLLIFIPLVNLIYGLYLMMKIAERRGFQSWIGLLMVVPLVGIIVPGYIAWAEPSKSK